LRIKCKIGDVDEHKGTKKYKKLEAGQGKEKQKDWSLL